MTIDTYLCPAPLCVDPEQPTGARVYDFLIGGHHHFAADRAAAETVLDAMPQVPQVMRANRSFLRRAVDVVAAEGIQQFLDLGSGIPIADNVHDVARRTHPDARVVYVDIDPVAVAHTRTMLADDTNADILRADLTDPDAVLADPVVRRLIDLTAPVCLLFVAVAHHVADTTTLLHALAAYRDAVPAGSYLIMSHLTDDCDPRAVDRARQAYNKAVAPLVLRSRGEFAQMLHGWQLMDPGLTYSGQWRPDSDDPEANEVASRCVLTAAGYKP
ncbi:SAM-dependent methyltransferase [Krasilnikovia sp. MM14-A1004]|uniref:SAM-dependent methyltransferase n=1 Tax=Krasilnikovia sp. MM14-A1004 TaxID=3373541 RepID=UPI00399D17B3